MAWNRTEIVEQLVAHIVDGFATEASFVKTLDRLDDYGSGHTPPDLLQLLGEARNLFRDGLTEEAVARLNLYVHPKWSDVSDCAKQYRAHMKAQRAVQSGKHP